MGTQRLFSQTPDSADGASLMLLIAVIKHHIVLWRFCMLSPSGLSDQATDTHAHKQTHECRHVHVSGKCTILPPINHPHLAILHLITSIEIVKPAS